MSNQKTEANKDGQATALAVATCSASFVLDCKGREILPGDTLKVFHFIGARRKRCYMYKYVLSVYKHPNWSAELDALRISHLNPQADSYLVLRRGQKEDAYEIVQGYGEDGRPYDERPKHEPNAAYQPVGGEASTKTKSNERKP